MARALGDRAAEARALWNIVVASVYGGGDASHAVQAGEARLLLVTALVVLDVPAMVTMGVHPLVAFLANMQVQRDGGTTPAP